MKAFALVLLTLIAGCSQPPQHDAAATCPELPRPLGDTLAAQRAYTLLVVSMYAQCASRP